MDRGAIRVVQGPRGRGAPAFGSGEGAALVVEQLALQPFLDPRRAGEVEKPLDGALEATDLLLEDRQVAAIQAGGGAAVSSCGDGFATDEATAGVGRRPKLRP
jgi:hypothetical protein